MSKHAGPGDCPCGHGLRLVGNLAEAVVDREGASEGASEGLGCSGAAPAAAAVEDSSLVAFSRDPTPLGWRPWIQLLNSLIDRLLMQVSRFFSSARL